MELTDLRLLSATALARLVRERRVTSRALVDAHIAHTERVNPHLNALVVDRFAAARREADAADDRVAQVARGARDEAGETLSLPPFHGVPCSIKESFAFTGMPNTAGLARRRGIVPTEDAPTVARLRAAGAIPLGVSNVSELCMWMEANNPVYGRTNNPYDRRCTAGGSSGGEGALVGSGATPFGLGSDIGGSIRMPAFFNGVFGHKPSPGLVPGTGQHPVAENEARRFLSTGPLCRRAEDLMPLLRILAGPDGVDPVCTPYTLGDPDAVDIGALRVLDVAGTGQPVARPLRMAQARVVQALALEGAQVGSQRFDGLHKAFDVWSAMLAAATDTPFAVMMGDGTHVPPLPELIKWTVGRSEHTAMASLLAISESLVARVPGYQRRMIDLGRALRAEIQAALGEHGVMLFPSHPRIAPRHNSPFRRQLLLRFDYAFTAIFNVLELPVTQVPLGLDRRGLPLGIQVAAAPGNDHLTIAVARFLERRFGGWVPPRALWAREG